MVHLVTYRLLDLSGDPISLSERDALPHGRGDEFARGPGSPDLRDTQPKVMPRGYYVRDPHTDTLRQTRKTFR